MSRPLLLVFGLYGFALACMQGLIPLIELSHWVAWLTTNWVEFTRAFWRLIASLFRLDISERIADLASSIVYTASLFIGYRRLDFKTKKILIMPSVPFFTLNKLVEEVLPIWISIPTRVLLSMLIFWQFFAVLILLYFSSSFMAYAVFGMCAFIGFLDDILPKRMYEKVLSMVMPEGDSPEEKELNEALAAAFLVTSAAVLLVLACILILNEISVRADNIINLYNRARCEAGIECLRK